MTFKTGGCFDYQPWVQVFNKVFLLQETKFRETISQWYWSSQKSEGDELLTKTLPPQIRSIFQLFWPYLRRIRWIYLVFWPYPSQICSIYWLLWPYLRHIRSFYSLFWPSSWLIASSINVFIRSIPESLNVPCFYTHVIINSYINICYV